MLLAKCCRAISEKDLWLHALGQAPAELITAIMLVAIPYPPCSFLVTRIHDRACFAWHPPAPAPIYWAGSAVVPQSLIKGCGW